MHKLSSEVFTAQFLELIDDRYPSPDRVRKMAKPLGIVDDIRSQIIVFSSIRDLCRKVSPRFIFKSFQHRDEVFLAIVDALEELEEELEILEEKEAQSLVPTSFLEQYVSQADETAGKSAPEVDFWDLDFGAEESDDATQKLW